MNYTPDRVRAALEFAKGVGLMPRSHFDVLTWLSENYADLAASMDSQQKPRARERNRKRKVQAALHEAIYDALLDFGRCPFDCEDELAERILEAINRLYRG